MQGYLPDHRQVCSFTGGGAQVQVITPTAGMHVLIKYIDLLANGITVAITMNAGTYDALTGTINSSPVQMNFSRGLGSGIADDPINVAVSGDCVIYIGYAEIGGATT